TTSLLEGIKSEREIMAPFKVFANYVYDTSDYKAKDFVAKLSADFLIKKEDRYHVSISSFGYKYGMPIDADNVIDVRFLNNPFYIEELREKTGLDDEVYNFVMSENLTKDFYGKLKNLILFLVDKYKYEGRDKV
ncbi:RNase adapter RapZ, partial [Streptococcus danieliae]|nr:RNase adapter RapZ [Streptococcus danieliae]